MLSPEPNTWAEPDQHVNRGAIVIGATPAPLFFALTAYSPPVEGGLTLSQSNIRGGDVRLPKATLHPDPFIPASGNVARIWSLPKLHRHARRRLGVPLVPTEEKFWLLKKWQDQILSIGPDSFEAQLFDP